MERFLVTIIIPKKIEIRDSKEGATSTSEEFASLIARFSVKNDFSISSDFSRIPHHVARENQSESLYWEQIKIDRDSSLNQWRGRSCRYRTIYKSTFARLRLRLRHRDGEIWISFESHFWCAPSYQCLIWSVHFGLSLILNLKFPTCRYFCY